MFSSTYEQIFVIQHADIVLEVVRACRLGHCRVLGCRTEFRTRDKQTNKNMNSTRQR
jgi:hypothetical protein